MLEELVENLVSGEEPASPHVDGANTLAFVADRGDLGDLLRVVGAENFLDAVANQRHDE